ncbi:hypothetical protein [Nocardia sp. NPDC059239]|uniref:hypothetical protein n=1 Tax=unclassified Nocardia TaxID=2637762 RepID=UPI0036BC3904
MSVQTYRATVGVDPAVALVDPAVALVDPAVRAAEATVLDPRPACAAALEEYLR